MRLLIIIPALNEAKNIKYVLDKIPENFRGITEFDVLVVDDGSQDKTSDIAEKEGAIVIKHSFNRGVGAAFKTGVNYAIRNGYDIMVNMDGDGQFNPNDIKRMIDPILNKKADFVTASRFKEGYKHDSFVKHLGNYFFTLLISRLVNKKFYDTQCGFRAYSRKTLLKLNVMGDFTYTQEVFIDLASKNVEMKEISIKVYPRKSGKSRVTKNMFKYLFNAIIIIMRSYRDYRPLTFFGIPGLILFIISSIIFSACFIYFIITQLVTPIKTWLFFASGIFFFGFLLIIIGLLSDMFDRHRRLLEEILYNQKK